MSTAAQFAARAARLGPAVREAEVRGARAAALRTVTVIREEIREAAPSGSLKMNGKRKKVGVGFRMLAGPKARISAQGPLHLLERDTQTHYIPRASQSSLLRYQRNRRTGEVSVSQRQRRGRAAEGKTLNIPGIGFRKHVLHPGTTGKHPFENGVTRARAELGRVILAEVADGIRAVLR